MDMKSFESIKICRPSLFIATTLVGSEEENVSSNQEGTGAHNSPGVPRRSVPTQPAERSHQPDRGALLGQGQPEKTPPEPPEQPGVDPLTRENPDVEEVEENEPDEHPEEAPQERPKPDTGVEIYPDRDPEIDTDPTPSPYGDEDGFSRSGPAKDPTVEPGTDPMNGPPPLFI